MFLALVTAFLKICTTRLSLAICRRDARAKNRKRRPVLLIRHYFYWLFWIPPRTNCCLVAAQATIMKHYISLSQYKWHCFMPLILFPVSSRHLERIIRCPYIEIFMHDGNNLFGTKSISRGGGAKLTLYNDFFFRPELIKIRLTFDVLAKMIFESLISICSITWWLHSIVGKDRNVSRHVQTSSSIHYHEFSAQK